MMSLLKRAIPALALFLLVPQAQALVESPTFRSILLIAQARTPPYASASAPTHEAVQQSFLRQGYELALATLAGIPYESPAESPTSNPLLDTRD